MSADGEITSSRIALAADSGELLEWVDHSATSTKKYSKFEGRFAKLLGLQPSAIYTTFVAKAGNVKVRLTQSSRARIATILIVLVHGPDERENEASIRALIKFQATERPDSEVLVLKRDSFTWSATLAIYTDRNAEPSISHLVQSWRDIAKIKSSRPRFEVSEQLEFGNESLQIISTATQMSRKVDLTYPLAVLEYQQWDDHGFRSTFSAKLYLSATNHRDLGHVKILSTSQAQGMTELPKSLVSTLPATHYSIGQNFDYYRQLDDLPVGLKDKYLHGMRDVTVLDEINLRSVRLHPGYTESLLRSAAAENIAIKEGVSRNVKGGKSSSQSFSYIPPLVKGVRNYDSLLTFNFYTDDYLPGRINALIGYNGVGKSRTLSSLAILASTSAPERSQLIGDHGSLDSEEYRYSAVFAVSYSAFDNFEHPLVSQSQYSLESDNYTYTYCGIRRIRGGSPQAELKNHQEIVQEYAIALDAIVSSPDRIALLARCTDLLSVEPSIARSTNLSLSNPGRVSVAEFANSSSGHKAVFHSLVLLVANLQPASLVLVDEPESHMHPSLLAMWLRVLSIILEDRDSHAIIATHSPVIIQELPARGVLVLERAGDRHYASTLPAESFGENLGRLVSSVFHLDATGADYHQTLRKMALSLSLDEAEELFGRGMSNQARAFFLAIQQSQAGN